MGLVNEEDILVRLEDTDYNDSTLIQFDTPTNETIHVSHG
jgi:hypothetical protein